MSSPTPVSPTTIHSFARSLLTAAGVSPEDSTTVADALLLADLRGVDTHGINRLPGYLARIKAGTLNPTPSLAFKQKTPVIAHLDAQNTFGFIAASLAVQKAASMAEVYGVGIVGVKNSSHFGMGAKYVLEAVEQGMAAVVMTNNSKSMPAWGSKEPLLGTAPFAVAFPGRNGDHWVLDMSPSIVARGKIRKALRREEKIPEGWALDADGRPTTDPAAALQGTVLPIGGPKGSGLGMMMDLFSGVISGSSFAGEVVDQYDDVTKKQGVGHWFMVFKPDVFLESMDEYYDRMAVLMKRVRESEKAPDFDRIYTSGEIEFIKEKESRKNGVKYTTKEIDTLHKLAKEWGCDARLT